MSSRVNFSKSSNSKKCFLRLRKCGKIFKAKMVLKMAQTRHVRVITVTVATNIATINRLARACAVAHTNLVRAIIRALATRVNEQISRNVAVINDKAKVVKHKMSKHSKIQQMTSSSQI